MKTSKKIIISVLFTLQFLPLMQNARADEPVKRTLLVTAYYSPLPNQSFYIRGSYEADVILNGRGIAGADGTPVYVGMLAAPKTYPFGTRVKIPGLGVGEVHDRGGAILAKDSYDRIDVWMGYGEDGLSRALNWGARTVEGEVYFSPDQIQPGLDFSWVSPQLPDSYVAKLQAKTAQNTTNISETNPLSASILDADQSEEENGEAEPPSPVDSIQESEEVRRLRQNRQLLVAGLGKEAQGEKVKDLQRMLWDLGYYKGELTGVYDQKTAEAVFRLQVEQGVLQHESDEGAGYFGKKTLASIDSALEKKIAVIEQYPREAQVWVPAKTLLPQVASLALPQVHQERQGLNFEGIQLNLPTENESYLAGELAMGDKNDQVVKLQELLIQRAYLAVGLNTGYFGPMTSEALLKFQQEKGIAGEEGRVGPETLKALNLL